MANFPSVFKNTLILPLSAKCCLDEFPDVSTMLVRLKKNSISIEYPSNVQSIKKLTMKGAYNSA